MLQALCTLVTVTQSPSQAAQKLMLNVRIHYSALLQGLDILKKHLHLLNVRTSKFKGGLCLFVCFNFNSLLRNKFLFLLKALWAYCVALKIFAAVLIRAMVW